MDIFRFRVRIEFEKDGNITKCERSEVFDMADKKIMPEILGYAIGNLVRAFEGSWSVSDYDNFFSSLSESGENLLEEKAAIKKAFSSPEE